MKRAHKGGSEGSHGMNVSKNHKGITRSDSGNVKSTFGRKFSSNCGAGPKGGNKRTYREGDTYK